MAGKNKIETGVCILYDDTGGTARDLSNDLVPGSLSINGLTYEEIGMTGVKDAVTNFLLGRGSIDISAQFYMNDTATTGAFTVLNAQNGANASTGNTLTIQFGSAGASPTTGDPELEGDFIVAALPTSNNSGAMIQTARFLPLSGGTAPAWGTVS